MNDVTTEVQSQIKYRSIIRTRSPLKAWYLTHFCGQTVRSIRRTPVMTLVGIILYSKSWIVVAYY